MIKLESFKTLDLGKKCLVIFCYETGEHLWANPTPTKRYH